MKFDGLDFEILAAKSHLAGGGWIEIIRYGNHVRKVKRPTSQEVGGLKSSMCYADIIDTVPPRRRWVD